MADLAYDPNTPNNHTPIGTAEHPFCGTFDGNNHTVSGIRISATTKASSETSMRTAPSPTSPSPTRKSAA